MNKAKGILFWVLYFIAIILLIWGMLSCSPTILHLTTDYDDITVKWDTDADEVFVQYYSVDRWVTDYKGLNRGTLITAQRGNMYRLMCVKDLDTIFSKIKYLK